MSSNLLARPHCGCSQWVAGCELAADRIAFFCACLLALLAAVAQSSHPPDCLDEHRSSVHRVCTRLSVVVRERRTRCCSGIGLGRCSRVDARARTQTTACNAHTRATMVLHGQRGERSDDSTRTHSQARSMTRTEARDWPSAAPNASASEDRQETLVECHTEPALTSLCLVLCCVSLQRRCPTRPSRLGSTVDSSLRRLCSHRPLLPQHPRRLQSPRPLLPALLREVEQSPATPLRLAR